MARQTAASELKNGKKFNFREHFTISLGLFNKKQLFCLMKEKNI